MVRAEAAATVYDHPNTTHNTTTTNPRRARQVAGDSYHPGVGECVPVAELSHYIGLLTGSLGCSCVDPVIFSYGQCNKYGKSICYFCTHNILLLVRPPPLIDVLAQLCWRCIVKILTKTLGVVGATRSEKRGEDLSRRLHHVSTIPANNLDECFSCRARVRHRWNPTSIRVASSTPTEEQVTSRTTAPTRTTLTCYYSQSWSSDVSMPACMRCSWKSKAANRFANPPGFRQTDGRSKPLLHKIYSRMLSSPQAPPEENRETLGTDCSLGFIYFFPFTPVTVQSLLFLFRELATHEPLYLYRSEILLPPEHARVAGSSVLCGRGAWITIPQNSQLRTAHDRMLLPTCDRYRSFPLTSHAVSFSNVLDLAVCESIGMVWVGCYDGRGSPFARTPNAYTDE